jgi:hypothetical protein
MPHRQYWNQVLPPVEGLDLSFEVEYDMDVGKSWSLARSNGMDWSRQPSKLIHRARWCGIDVDAAKSARNGGLKVEELGLGKTWATTEWEEDDSDQ